jgi:hypothetical protein
MHVEGRAQSPEAAAPRTLWELLGIPKAIDKVRDAAVNPLGNHPKLERVPPLKRIADPANLQADNPAMQAAAASKADADLAEQKIKAIKYLATVGCACNKYREDVKTALLAALDDCEEEVRYEAAMALCRAAGDPCTHCNQASCCDAQVMNKLAKIAHGEDAQGCPLENSPHVRGAAAAALEACRSVRGPSAAPAVEPGSEQPSRLGQPKAASAAIPERDLFSPVGSVGWFSSDVPEGFGELSGQFAQEHSLPLPGSLEAGAAAPGEALDPLEGYALAGWPGRGGRICPPCRRHGGLLGGGRGVEILEEGAAPEAVAPEEGRAPPEALAPRARELGPTSTELAGIRSSGIVGIIGDAHGGSGRTTTLEVPVVKGGGSATGYLPGQNLSGFSVGGGQETVYTPGTYLGGPNGSDASGDGLNDTWQLTRVVANPTSRLLRYQGRTSGNSFNTKVGSTATLNGGQSPTDPAINGDVTDLQFSNGKISVQAVALVVLELPPLGLRTLKLAENNSPIPRDRFFFTYNYFNNVILDGGGRINVNRYIAGAEKTLFDGMASLELRIPFSSTINSDQYTDERNFTDTEFGNVTLIYKHVLAETERTILAGGMGLVFPTADDARLFDVDGVQLVHLNNDMVRLQPYLGLAHKFNDRLFFQSFVQLDVMPRGNRIYGAVEPVPAQPLPLLGRLDDQPLLFADGSINWWLYRDESPFRKGLTGIVPSLELHYTSSLNNADSIRVSQPTAFGTDAIDIRSMINRFDYLNLTFGTHFVFGRGATITPGLVIPLRKGYDKEFDGEFVLDVNVPF